MEQTWQLVENNDLDRINEYAAELNSSPVLAKLLLSRGVTDIEAARLYFLPKLERLHDPNLMLDMDIAVERVEKALLNKEKILIYGDYDVDGTTATAMMVRFFRKLHHPVDFYIPDRMVDGYGLSKQSIGRAIEKNISLLITVDCGVTAVDEIAYARESGIDVIVCDHHQHDPILPKANAILNPKREGCNYPFKDLAGVGVAFKLLQAMQRKLNLDESVLFDLLYFVALGSAADIVPLVDENRIFVKHGLHDLTQAQKNLGLKALMERTRLHGRQIGTGQVVFVIAPRINAVGRLGDASRAVELFLTDDEGTAEKIAEVLEEENRLRRQIDETTLAEATEFIEENYDAEKESLFVLNSDKWHPGIIGIVASRIVERYFRPTVMIATENGQGRGSARSIPGFDIYGVLKQCEDLMLSFGGHKYAAGLSIEVEKIPELRQRLASLAADSLTEEMLAPKLSIDAELRFKNMDNNFLKLIQRMEPFGPRNTRPTFVTYGLQIVGSPDIVGKNHLRFKVRQDGKVMNCIGFNLGDKLYRVTSGDDIDMVYVIDENEYMGRKAIQLRVKDIR